MMANAQPEAPVTCWLVGDTGWFGPAGLLEGFLDALESASLVPDRYGRDERHMKPFTRRGMLAMRPKAAGREWFVAFARDAAPAYDGSIFSRQTSTVRFRCCEPDDTSRRLIFELGDHLARFARPRLAAASTSLHQADPAPGRDETLTWIKASSNIHQPYLRQYGLIGLAPRTYFGPDIVELIGRARIDALALPMHWFDDGTVRIDLVPEPWNAAPEDLVEPWRAAMEILRPSEVFSTGHVTASGMLIPRRGKRWV